MDMLDVLYTPLDIPLCPKIDIKKLDNWIDKHYPQKSLLEGTKGILTAHNLLKETYPWKSTFAKLFDWKNNFNIEFPEIVKYLKDDWGLLDEEIEVLLILPAKKDLVGWGFWHSDADYMGLRFYIDFDNNIDNKIFLSQRKKDTLDTLNKNYDLNNDLLPYQIEAKLTHPRQAFYLNNVRGGHAVWNSSPSSRYAVILGTSYDSPVKREMSLHLRNKFNKLIIDSAMKFKESIFCDFHNGVGYSK